MTRQPSPATKYFDRAREHYPDLELTKPKDENFLIEYLGCSSSMKKMWRTFGIRKIYYQILNLLDENKRLRKTLNENQKKLDELKDSSNYADMA